MTGTATVQNMDALKRPRASSPLISENISVLKYIITSNMAPARPAAALPSALLNFLSMNRILDIKVFSTVHQS